MNKKEYIKLEAYGSLPSPMKENIAASGVPVPPDIPDHGDVFVGDDDVFENDCISTWHRGVVDILKGNPLRLFL